MKKISIKAKLRELNRLEKSLNKIIKENQKILKK